MKPDTLTLLQAIGFKRIGHWSADDEGIGFVIPAQPLLQSGGGYAFVIANKVKHLGEFSAPLAVAMKAYCHPNDASDIHGRVGRKILTYVSERIDVDIYVLGGDVCHRRQADDNVSPSPFHERLVRRIRPCWHGR